MNIDPGSVTCLEFQEQLAELLDIGADLENHPHLQQCDCCRALVRDLETIAKFAGHPPLGDDDSFGSTDRTVLPKVPNRGRGSVAVAMEFGQNGA